jgi:mannose-6-phosphate isomerase-like protein (cupin superfamily)
MATSTTSIVQSADHVAVVNLGALSDLSRVTLTVPGLSFKVQGKVFLKQLLGLTGAEISLNALPPGHAIPFLHKHHLNEEIYVVVKGNGEFQVDGRVFPVQEGTVVRIDPSGARSFRNTSTVDVLCYVVIQARAGSLEDHTIQDGYRVPQTVTWENLPPL